MRAGTVTFRVPDASAVDFVRLYVGKQSRAYDVSFDLRQVQLANRDIMASEPGLKRILEMPGVYFVALTSVNASGRESDFSNEIRIDTRVSQAALTTLLALQMLSPERSLPGSVGLLGDWVAGDMDLRASEASES